MTPISEQLYWFEENGRYTLGRHSNGYPTTFFEKQLPQFSQSDEEVLKELKANYRVESNGYLSVFDPMVEEWEDIGAPVLKVQGFHIVAESGFYKGKVPSQRMLEAAKEYGKKLRKQIYRIALSEEKKWFDDWFHRTTSDGISKWWEQSDWDYLRVSNMDEKYYFFDLSRILSGDIYCTEGLIILKSAVQGKSSITLKVPRYLIGRIIGKGGCNAKRLAKEIGVRYIKVEPDTEYRL